MFAAGIEHGISKAVKRKCYCIARSLYHGHCIEWISYNATMAQPTHYSARVSVQC